MSEVSNELSQQFSDLKINLDSEDHASSTAAAEAVLATPTEAELGGLGMPDMPVPGSDEIDKDSDVTGKLFVGGISWQTSEESLSYHFSKFGALADVALMKDKYTGQPRGFGFIKFEDPSVLDAVLAQPEHNIDGRVVDVKRAVPKSEAPGPARATRQADFNKVFVGGLAPSVTAAEFRQYFEGFGAVSDAVVMFDRQTQRSRGFGFVTFQDDSVVQNVLMGTHELNGKMVEVKTAEPKESRRNASPGGGRGLPYGMQPYGMPMAGRGMGGRHVYGRNGGGGAAGGGATSPYGAAGYGVYGASAAAAAAAYGSAYGAAAAAAYGSYPAYAAYTTGGYGAGAAGYSAPQAAGYAAYRAGAGGYDAAAAGAAQAGAPPPGQQPQYAAAQLGPNGYGVVASPGNESYSAEYGALRGQPGSAPAGPPRSAEPPAYGAQPQY